MFFSPVLHPIPRGSGLVPGVCCRACLKEGHQTHSQPALVDTLLADFDVKHSSNILTSPVVELGPTTDDDVVTDRSFRQAVGGAMWLAGVTRLGIADLAMLWLAINIIYVKGTRWR